MKEIKLGWTWKLESPLHQGTGLSRPGFADSLIKRDSANTPYFTGDAVKGALRMSAEHILAWQNITHDICKDGKTAEPTHPLLSAIFGGNANAHFGRAYVKNYSPKYSTVASTAINKETGSAKVNCLRLMEVLDAGATFESECSVWVDSNEEAVAAFLIASLAATEWIGGRTGTGWGKVKLEKTKLSSSSNPQELLSHLDLNIKAPNVSDSSTAAATEESAPVSDEKIWHKFVFTLKEPTCVGARPAVANSLDTLDSIPATTLRGAFRAAWLREGVSEAEIVSWLNDSTQWTPALPMVDEANTAVPVPHSYLAPKGNEGLACIHDELTGMAPPDSIQWRTPEACWMDMSGRNDIKIQRETTMHSARNYEKGSKRKNALYARSHIDPNNRQYAAWAMLPQSALIPDKIYIGKRKSAGHGWAQIKTTEGEPVKKEAGPRNFACIQLLSPAIVRGEDGFPLFALDNSAWNKILGSELVGRCVAKSSVRQIPGWMATWNHSRALVTAIDTGSVWRLEPAPNHTIEELRKALITLSHKGLGERLHEGFGWITVDPAWLGERKVENTGDIKADEDKKWLVPDDDAKVRSWPGISDDVTVGQLEEIVTDVKKINKNDLPPDLRGPLQELLTRAREPDSNGEQVLEFADKRANRDSADKRANRDRPGQWSSLEKNNETRKVKPARSFLDRYKDNMELLRFALQALLIQLNKEDK